MDLEDNEDIVEDIVEDCAICGVCLKDKYCHQLLCGHKFHYECIMKTFDSTIHGHGIKYKQRCPYCRAKVECLPIVNGLKKIELYVHTNNYKELHKMKKNHVNTSCKHILKKGKRKGDECGKNCKLGYEYCNVHNKI
tara:strand:- start:237 stop:647 length:411 start_codon:yes stop_codon:yes gene_type:complete